MSKTNLPGTAAAVAGDMMQGQSHFIHRPVLKGSDVVTVEIGPQVDFVYIVRKDGVFTVSPLAHKMSVGYGLKEVDVKQALLEEYDRFFNELTHIFYWGFSQKGNFELHLYEPGELDTAIIQRANNIPIVSLDPLICHGVYSLTVSRAYYLGGKKDTGQIARPGYASLNAQAQQIAERMQGQPVCVVEDDIFSGGSIIASLDKLTDCGVTIQKIIPGIQIGSPHKITQSGLAIDPVVKYKTIDGADIFDKVDLGDPRDYLLGASGLVVHLPQRAYGRAPYILPFVSTSARSSVPQQAERGFALKVLEANWNFFHGVEGKLGQPLLLGHMDEHFTNMMHQLYGFDYKVPMRQIVTWAIDNIDSIWEITQHLGELQGQLDTMLLRAKQVTGNISPP